MVGMLLPHSHPPAHYHVDIYPDLHVFGLVISGGIFILVFPVSDAMA